MSNAGEQQYLDLLQELVNKSEDSEVTLDRTGVGTHRLFHRTMRFNLQDGFPLLTTKRMSLNSIIGELLWFISGSTNAIELEEKYGCTIWREWGDQDGNLGKVYGHQYRNFGHVQDFCEITATLNEGNGWYDVVEGFDQLEWLINEIKANPASRRLYVTAIDPQSRGEQALDTCHNYFQVFIEDGKLNLYFQMRSNDFFLGNPYNIASYAVLAHMLALECGYEVGELVYSGIDVHLYSNHIEQAKLQLTRTPYKFPTIKINKKPFFEYELSDFEVVDYEHHATIKADVAI